MKFLFTSYVILLVLRSCYSSEIHKYASNVKILSLDESSKMISGNTSKAGVETTKAEQTRAVPPDNGYGNYGDLIHRYRENDDTLILREVIIIPFLASTEQDIQWYASTHASRISSVRVLNFGRERAYTIRIDVAGNVVQAFLRVPPRYDPRIMIEVYGF